MPISNAWWRIRDRPPVASCAAKTSPTFSTLTQSPGPSEKQFKCDQCDFSSKSLRGLKVHNGRSHKDSQLPEQLLCEDQDDSSLNLSHQSHQREEAPSLIALLSPSRPKLWQTFLPLRKNVLPEREKEALKCRSCDESFTVQTVRVVKIAAVLILDMSMHCPKRTNMRLLKYGLPK